MDWEFAYSGCPLGDFGNFFRYENEMSPCYKESFVESYKKNGGEIVKNWQEQARFLDLLPMFQFLTRPGDYPKTFRTAISVIQNTIK